MRSYEGCLCKLLKIPATEKIEYVRKDKIKIGDEGIVLKQFSDKTLYVEFIDSDGNPIAYCYLNQEQVSIKGKPKVKQQNKP